ncbi:coenzyme F420-dependent NADP oxidoreductase [Corynebacterium suranareeae]|uniref:Coenzyme F420-dependent NADP oxidoreductase n=1 Tax=Corynebacterium suranareeae TaxID=2506452 RepID=A0A160PQL9_9CORY|nr:NADPH-dependent F420 reductase [Corynebacterium suranareeae]BAU96407.1 coenzyme F420-dependent NADP oxidoreductase [Corynebacterium suranareeae]
MTTIGLIGAGLIGSTLARLAVAAGYDVVLSNCRGPDTLTDLVDELGDRARAGTPEEAATAGDIVIVTMPLHAYKTVPVEPLKGKVVIDTNNYYPDRDEQIPELDDESTTTSELLQAHLPESKVVKAFSNIFYLHLGSLNRPAGDPDRSVLAIAGDDKEAKQKVTEFLNAIGYDALDAAPLSEGWRFQRDTAAHSVPYFGNPDARPTLDGNFDPGEGKPVNRDLLSARLAEAKRYRDQ